MVASQATNLPAVSPRPAPQVGTHHIALCPATLQQWARYALPVKLPTPDPAPAAAHALRPRGMYPIAPHPADLHRKPARPSAKAPNALGNLTAHPRVSHLHTAADWGVWGIEDTKILASHQVASHHPVMLPAVAHPQTI